MSSKISRLCEAIIEAGWLAALIIVPVFFNVYSSRVFEPDKISLLRSIALVMIGAWLIKLIDGGGAAAPLPASATQTPRGNLWRQIRETPLIIPALLLVSAYLISTALSVAPRISFWGSYQRMQGTYSTFSYIVIFFLTLTHLRSRVQLNRLLHAIVIASLPVALYGILQHYSLDPLPWGGDVKLRVAGNMGNAIFIAAYLIIAFFVTLERFLRSAGRLLAEQGGEIADALLVGSYVFVLVVQSVAIIFSQSRGPWLGWFAGIYIFVLLGLIALRSRATRRGAGFFHWAWLGWIGLAVAGVAFLISFNLPNSPLAALRSVPYVGRLGQIFETEEGTGKVRVLIWEGASQMILPHAAVTYPDGTPDPLNALRPIFGYGPEAMWVAYNPFYPPDLAHYEARNASPDRSHNETFDALIITGAWGFIAYVVLFGSIFYWTLRWLGWVRNRQDAILFLALTLLGGLGGALIPWLALGDLRYLGVAIPAGLILGFIVYLTISAFRSDFTLQMTGSRALLLLAILSAIAAHFVEIHFGIAIAATRTYFWTLTAVLLVTGLGWLDLSDEEPVEATSAAAAMPSSFNMPFPSAAPMRTAATPRKRRSGASLTRELPGARSPAARSGVTTSWIDHLLPYAFLAAIVFVTLIWNFMANQGRDTNAFNVILNALFFKNRNGQPAVSLGIWWLHLFTWLVAGIIALGDVAANQRKAPTGAWWLRGLGLYSAVVWGMWLIFSLIHGARVAQGAVLQGSRVSVEQLSDFVASYIVDYYVAAFVVILILGWALWRSSSRRLLTWTARGLVTSFSAALIGVIVITFVSTVNIGLVRADTYYKQGQAYDGVGQWQGAIFLYRKALAIAPDEDYYYLFLGRSALEQAKVDTDPAERQRWLDDALSVLTRAQTLNPLNTDHTANLARFYRSRGELQTSTTERERDWQTALTYYQAATRLSPNAAHLFNEKGLVYFLLANLARDQQQPEVADDYFEDALIALSRSLELDQIYPQTYLFLGDVYRSRGDNAKAIEAYQQTLKLSPGQALAWSALGYIYAQQGNLTEAISANQKVTQLSPGDAASWRNLAILYQQTNQIQLALAAAQEALKYAPEADKPALQALVQQLQAQLPQ